MYKCVYKCNMHRVSFCGQKIGCYLTRKSDLPVSESIPDECCGHVGISRQLQRQTAAISRRTADHLRRATHSDKDSSFTLWCWRWQVSSYHLRSRVFLCGPLCTLRF